MQAEADWGSRPITVETFTDCVNLCTFDEACEFLQFNYAAEEGNCRLKVAPTMATTRWVSDHMCLSRSNGPSSITTAGTAPITSRNTC